jgi:hypothetical protein
LGVAEGCGGTGAALAWLLELALAWSALAGAV